MLWMILTLMTALAAVGLAIPLIRRHDAARRPRDEVVETLQSQLGEIDAQTAAGAVSGDEAEALKTDVKRRMLAEQRAPEAPARPLGERALLKLALGLAAVVVLGATGLYLAIGRPDVPATRPQPAAMGGVAAAADHPQGEVSSMIAALEAKMKESPDDPEGWRMLGWSYLQTGRNAEAAEAYGKAAALSPGNAEYLSAQGEATVLAAEGQVTPAAVAAFRKAVAADRLDPRARYYLAVAKDQAGDQKGAMDDWIALLRDAPPDAPWAGQIRQFVEQVAADRGVNLAGRLPPLAAAQAPPPQATPSQAAPSQAAPRGPTAADVAAAGQMSAGDRQAMIEGMVAQLAARLKASPGDRAGWERLIRAQMVLGRPAQAQQAYRDATRAFAGSPADLATLREAASSSGVPGV